MSGREERLGRARDSDADDRPVYYYDHLGAWENDVSVCDRCHGDIPQSGGVYLIWHESPEGVRLADVVFCPRCNRAMAEGAQ